MWLAINYENFAKFDAKIRESGERLACMIMEPVHSDIPESNFLQHVRDAAYRAGAPIIFDETTVGGPVCSSGFKSLAD